jgi:hypothetical protein
VNSNFSRKKKGGGSVPAALAGSRFATPYFEPLYAEPPLYVLLCIAFIHKTVKFLTAHNHYDPHDVLVYQKDADVLEQLTIYIHTSA